MKKVVKVCAYNYSPHPRCFSTAVKCFILRVKSPDYFVKEIVKDLSSLFEKSFRISLVWLPAHCGITGNKQAYSCLAKRGAAEGSFFECPILPHECLQAP